MPVFYQSSTVRPRSALLAMDFEQLDQNTVHVEFELLDLGARRQVVCRDRSSHVPSRSSACGCPDSSHASSASHSSHLCSACAAVALGRRLPFHDLMATVALKERRSPRMRRGRLKTSRLEQSPGEKRSAEFGMSSRLADDPVC